MDRDVTKRKNLGSTATFFENKRYANTIFLKVVGTKRTLLTFLIVSLNKKNKISTEKKWKFYKSVEIYTPKSPPPSL